MHHRSIPARGPIISYATKGHIHPIFSFVVPNFVFPQTGDLITCHGKLATMVITAVYKQRETVLF